MADPPARISFVCKSCGKKYAVKPELAGKSAKCGCGAKLVIPTPPSPATAALASSSNLSTELVLPPDIVGKPDPSDDEYEIEPPVARPVHEALRRAAEDLAASDAAPSASEASPTRAFERTSQPTNGPSLVGSFFLAAIILVSVATLAEAWAGWRLTSAVDEFSAVYRKLPSPPHLQLWRVSEQQTEVDRAFTKFALVGSIKSLVSLVAFIAYLVWLYKSHSRLQGMSVANLRFTPGWAVGYQFIPFWNLIRPYQIMREIWHGSDPDGEPLNDCSPEEVRSSWLVRLWWASVFVGGTVCTVMFFNIASASSALPPPQNHAQALAAATRFVPVQQVGLLFTLAYYVLLGLVVWKIERRQAERLAALYSIA
ncbi:DUF4328 domain-containing protein [Lacipirellula sp.]|uniref:DUF4328 domain-containing protein n=1 Tax=Lacipirellula sp. TaxID=2691419 RepID=UPI003D0DE045